MKEKKKFGFNSQVYAAPRAESIEMGNEGLLCASTTPVGISGNLEGFTGKNGEGW